MTVSRATLHNEEDLARKDIREGDQVVIMRAGRRDPAGRVPDHPAPHGQGETVRATAEVPGVRHADRQAGGRGLDPLPEPQGLPRPDRAGAQALRLPRGDGHRGIRREVRDQVLRAGPRARAAGPLRAHGRASSSSSRASSAGRPRTWSPRSSARRTSRSTECCTRSGSRASAPSTRVRSPRISGRWTGCWPPRKEEIEEVEGIGPDARRRRSARRWRAAQPAADRGPARARAEHGGGRAGRPGRRPAARGQDVRADGHARRA